MSEAGEECALRSGACLIQAIHLLDREASSFESCQPTSVFFLLFATIVVHSSDANARHLFYPINPTCRSWSTCAMSRQRPDLPHQQGPAKLPNPQSSSSFWHSQPSALLTGHHSTRSLPETADVVVIGSGMTGASIAHHLLARGEHGQSKPSVVMLEAREACWGATGRVRISLSMAGKSATRVQS